MKKKYLLRGIGIGLIIGMAVSYTAFKTGDYTDKPAEGTTASSEEKASAETEKASAEEEKKASAVNISVAEDKIHVEVC